MSLDQFEGSNSMQKNREHEKQRAVSPQSPSSIEKVAHCKLDAQTQSKGQIDGDKLGLAAHHHSQTYPKTGDGFQIVKSTFDGVLNHANQDSFKNFNDEGRPDRLNGNPSVGPDQEAKRAESNGKRCKQNSRGSWPPLARAASMWGGHLNWRSSADKQFQTESHILNGFSSKINPLYSIQIETKLQNVQTTKNRAANVTNSPLFTQTRYSRAQSVTQPVRRVSTILPPQNMSALWPKLQPRNNYDDANQNLRVEPHPNIQSEKYQGIIRGESELADDQKPKQSRREHSQELRDQLFLGQNKIFQNNQDSKSISNQKDSDQKEQFEDEGKATSVQSLYFKAHLSDDTPKVIKIPKFVPDKQNCSSARKRKTDGGLQLDGFSSASGSKDLKNQNNVGSPAKAPKRGRKRQRKRNKKPKGSQVQIPSIGISLDFLDDEENQLITPQNQSKPLQQTFFKNDNSKSFMWQVELSSQSSKSGDSLPFFKQNRLVGSQAISEKNSDCQEQKQQIENGNLPFDLEFLTADQVKNFDKFQPLNNQADNDSGKLNVSLQSSEENKILEQNGGDLVQLKSSPMMRPRTYRATNTQSPSHPKKEEESEEEELTHDQIILKLLSKLHNESKSPTKLKVQENLQRNVNFYEEGPEVHRMHRQNQSQQYATGGQPQFQQPMAFLQREQMVQHSTQEHQMFHGHGQAAHQAHQIHHPQPQYMQNPQQPTFSFQLNPCFDMAGQIGPHMNQIHHHHHQNAINFQQSGAFHQAAALGGPAGFNMYPQQQNMMVHQQPPQQQVLIMNGPPHQQQQQFMQHNVGFCPQGDPQLPIQQPQQTSGSMPMMPPGFPPNTHIYSGQQMVTAPPPIMMMTDLDNQMRQLPINIQYALLTDEHFMQKQFEFEQMQQKQQSAQQLCQQQQLLQSQGPLPNNSMPGPGAHHLFGVAQGFGAMGLDMGQAQQQQQQQQVMGSGCYHNAAPLHGAMQQQMMSQQPPYYSSLPQEMGCMSNFVVENHIEAEFGGHPQQVQSGLFQQQQQQPTNQQQQLGGFGQVLGAGAANVVIDNFGSQPKQQRKQQQQWLITPPDELLESLQSSMANQLHLYDDDEQKNKHRLAFERRMKPIGFDTEANLHGFQWKQSAFKINQSYVRLFNKRDESDSASKSNDLSSPYGSPQKYTGSPDAVGRSQSIFSESTYQNDQSPKKKSSPQSNRLLQMTVNINQMFDKVFKYKRARAKYLQEIRMNKTQVDYIQTKTGGDHSQSQQLFVSDEQAAANNSNENGNQGAEGGNNNKLSLFTQEHSFGRKGLDSSHQPNNLNDYSGLCKNNNIVEQDDSLFEERLRWDRKNSKRYQRDSNEEIGLGSGGEYVLKENQIINSPENVQYKIVQYLGQGTFGQVVKVINLQKGTEHAVKIIKKKTEFIQQGMVEIKILEKLNNSPDRTEFEKQHLIKMEDYFVFRDYLCIVFELLSSSLYEQIQETDRGLSLNKVREYTRQILEALVTCKQSNLIHCDLKPENILTVKDGYNVKLIDFGSAAFNGHQVYTYIQSRYYRAPEVLMGCQKYPTHNIFSGEVGQPVPLYDQSIDMWSLACTAIEMFIKIPIFPGKYDYDQLLKILEFCGEPNQHMILNSQNRERFFYYNLQQQRYVFKTFYDFIWTMVPPHMQDKVEQPMNYHQYYNFPELLENHYISQLRKEKCEKYMTQQREYAKENKNHCFIPFNFEYKYEEKVQIRQFIDFVQQILQIDQTKRLTPLQALSHPFITRVNVPLPFIPASEMQLKRFRTANLQSQQQQFDDNFSSRADYEFPIGRGQGIPLPLSETQRSISAPLPKRFSLLEFFKINQQKNGTESFRPPIYALPENLFYGNCCETTISEFYQESKIRFQIYQDENLQHADIEFQKKLLQSHKFCDVEYNGLDSYLNQQQDGGGYQRTDSLESEDFDRKSSISVLEIQRQKSIMQIKEDKSIRQPKVTESEKFIREFFEREVMTKVTNEAVKRQQNRMKEEMKEQEMHQSFFEYYRESFHERHANMGQKIVKQWEGNTKQQVDRTLSSVDLFDDSQLLSQPRKGLIFFKKEKERSNSSDTIQKQQSQQPDYSLFSKNPVIQEENDHGSKENVPSPISSINSGEAKSQSNLNSSTKKVSMMKNFKFKSQLQSSAACKIEKSHQEMKPVLKYSKLNVNGQEESSLKEHEEVRQKKNKCRNRKKKLRHGKVKTPIKNDGFQEFEGHSIDDHFLNSNACRFGSTPATEFGQPGCQSQCEPFSKHFSKKSSSAFADPDCCPSHSGSDFDTEHDTDYGKQLDKKGSENNEGCLTNFKGSTRSLRNNTFSNNNSFENPDYLDQLSGSIKEIAQNNGGEDDQSPELGGIACLRAKRSVKKTKKKKN